MGGLSLLVGLVLLVPAVPLLVSNLAMAPGDWVLKRIRYHQHVDAKAISLLGDTREQALTWWQQGSTWTDFGLAMGLRANHTHKDRHALLQKARAATTQGLALAPANPYAWFRLARLRLELDGETPAAARSVSLALATGPYESTLLWPKLETGLRVWDELDANDHATLKSLIPQARHRDLSRMVRLAAKTRHLNLLFTPP